MGVGPSPEAVHARRPDMSAFSPLDAAFEGVRVVRREPRAVLYWIAVWALAIAAIGAIKAASGPVTHTGAARNAVQVIRSYGPFAAVLIPTLLALWVMNTATVYRAVLRPGEHGWHLFKLGAEEARVAVINAVGTVLLVLFGGVPAYLLFVLFSPIFAAAPGLNWMIAFVGALITVALEIWIAVRFSLAPVETFASASFPLAAYWGLTRRRFWRLLGAYALVALEIALFFVLFAIVGLLAEPLFNFVVMHWHGPQVLRLIVILGVLVPIAAISSGVAFVGPSILICGCQAYAYRAIAQSDAPATDTAAEPAKA